MVRCPVCRSRRATFVSLLAHQKKSGHHNPCGCGHVSYGGDAFPHRPGSPGCAYEKWDDLFVMPAAKNLGQRCPF